MVTASLGMVLILPLMEDAERLSSLGSAQLRRHVAHGLAGMLASNIGLWVGSSGLSV